MFSKHHYQNCPCMDLPLEKMYNRRTAKMTTIITRTSFLRDETVSPKAKVLPDTLKIPKLNLCPAQSF